MEGAEKPQTDGYYEWLEVWRQLYAYITSGFGLTQVLYNILIEPMKLVMLIKMCLNKM
jgi:hypothetical protein